MSKQICMHFIVSGKVQGVWFRASTKKKADEIELTGWVKNLSDGNVAVLACGELDQVKKLQAWLQIGPELARVKEVLGEERDWEEHGEFLVL